jgi:hypothetical protein
MLEGGIAKIIQRGVVMIQTAKYFDIFKHAAKSRRYKASLIKANKMFAGKMLDTFKKHPRFPGKLVQVKKEITAR